MLAYLWAVVGVFGDRQGIPTRIVPSRHVYTCGYRNVWLSEALFGVTAGKLGTDMSAYSTSDVCIHGLFGPCKADLRRFPGQVIYFNGESAAGNWHFRNQDLYLGPHAKKYDGIQLFHVVRKYTVLGGVLPPRGPRGTKYLMYVASNCVPLRQRAFDEIAEKLPFRPSAGGRCYGSHPELRVTFASHGHFHDNHLALRGYRFVLCMENANVAGYISEKLLNAFGAGAIPIYYGTRDVFQVFNKHAFVFYDINDPRPALALIRELETDPAAYAHMRAQPVFAPGAVRKHLDLRGELRQRILAALHANRGS